MGSSSTAAASEVRRRQLPGQGISTSQKSNFGAKDDITGIVFDNAGEQYANKRAAMYGHSVRGPGQAYFRLTPTCETAMLAHPLLPTTSKERILLTPKEDILAIIQASSWMTSMR